MRAFRSVAASLALLALLGIAGTASAQPPGGSPTPPTGGTPPLTRPVPSETSGTMSPAFPGLTADQQAQLKTEATTLVTGILTLFQLTLPEDEEMFLVDLVYHLLVFLTLMQSFFGGAMSQ
jgi:hypothetical protein